MYSNVHPDIDFINFPGSKVECNKVSHSGLSLISNSGFETIFDINDTNPFPKGYVHSWVESHGTPSLNDFQVPLTTPTDQFKNYASMYSWSELREVNGEGITQALPKIKKGDKYRMSFFKKLAREAHEFNDRMDKFLIVLIHCKDYERIHKYPDYNIPILPAASQVIYTENNMLNNQWQEVFKEFIAEDDYDMIWIYPIQSNEISELQGVDFTGLIITPNFIDGNFNCSAEQTISGCNYIPNPNFQLIDPTLPSNGYSAFFYNNVVDWSDTHGTSDVLNAQPPLTSPSSNYVRMIVGGVNISPDGSAPVISGSSEGIAVKTRTLQANKTFLLSFFMRSDIVSNNQIPAAQNVNFKIALVKCQNFPIFTSFAIPPLTNPNQVIYCENFSNLESTPWKQIVVRFTTSEEFNMLRIFPELLQFPPTLSGSAIYFAFPEIIDITNFSIGTPPIPTLGNCTINIGPTIPNCSIANAIFTWNGPNGLSIIPPSSQQISIDASVSSNAGIWNLQMTVPNSQIPLNSCLNSANIPVNVSNSLSVAACQPPFITVASYFEYGVCSPSTPNNSLIIPNSTNNFCYYWECGGFAHFISSVNNGNNQWYVNDILVPSGAFASSPLTGTTNTTNQHELILSTFQSQMFYKVQVQNTTNGFSQLSTATYIFFAPTWGTVNSSGFEHGGWYKANYSNTFSPPNINHGPNAIYSWTLPNTCSPIFYSSSNPSITINFGPNVPQNSGDYLLANLAITNSFCDRIVPVRFYYNANIIRLDSSKVFSQNIEVEKNNIDIFPNPANDVINFVSPLDKIFSIEIRNIFGQIINRINLKSNKRVTLNISHLKPGIYICTFITSKGSQTEKIVIN